MKLVGNIFKHILAPFIVVVLTPLGTSIGSKLKTGNWTELFEKTPCWTIYVFFIAIVLWLISILIWKRIKTIKEDNAPIFPFSTSTPMYGRDKIGQLRYAKVKWNILHPSNPTWTQVETNLNAIEVDLPPICPQCGTEIKEMKNFWGKYVWSCIKCGFKIKSKESFWIVEEDVKKIAKSEIIRLEKNKRK